MSKNAAMAETLPAWVDGTLVAVDKLEVHRLGLLHPAVSVFLLDGPRTLLQRRAMGKYHTPGLWANACCTHPHWGEASADCAAGRLRQELGIGGLELVARGSVEYRAEVGGGMVEHERVQLFTADVEARLRLAPDPAEVMATRWVALAELRAEVAERPERFTPWLRIYLSDHAEGLFGKVA
jgi:isopentenyl-diphosphate Delta-isomerase